MTVAGTPPQELRGRRSRGRGRELAVRGVNVGCRHSVLLLALLATLVLIDVYGKPYSQRARVGGRSFPSVSRPLVSQLHPELVAPDSRSR